MNRVNVSIGTAGALGLAEVAMDVAPTAAYLMLGGRCRMTCRFCAQARVSTAGALKLSRVTWPEFPLAETVHRLARAVECGAIRRCCLQVTRRHWPARSAMPCRICPRGKRAPARPERTRSSTTTSKPT